MKFHYFLPVLSVFVLSCTGDFNEGQLKESQSVKISSENFTQNDLNAHLVIPKLIKSYNDLIAVQPVYTLDHKIEILNIAANQNSDFASILPMNYTSLSVVEAEAFFTDVDLSYSNLDVSVTVKQYLDQILIPTTELSTMKALIDKDENLKVKEVQLLHFTADTFQTAYGENGDESWRKNMIVGILLGIQKSPANAVFNATLVKINM